jgi:glycosyltransferase involved in cell wall biosynthesis
VGKFVRTAQRERCVLFHANDLPSFQPAGYAAKVLGKSAICHVRFPDTHDGFKWFLRPGFSKALFISESLQSDALSEAPDLFTHRSELVYDGVHVPPLADAATRRKLREELGLPLDRPIVVLAGQIAEVKGLWDYIAAAKILADRGLPVLFAVMGDDLRNNGALRIEAERVVRERGLAASVQFLGFQPRAPLLMPAFDIVAVPSHVEPLGLAALEGMAAARPVVGSRVGGIVETVVDGVTGTLVPPEDAGTLANAIEFLVANPERAESYGAQGRKRTLERFSVDAHVARVQSVYDTLLGTVPPVPSTRAVDDERGRR